MEKELFDSVAALQNEHWWFKARKSFAMEALRQGPAGKAGPILDIGCGSGVMIDFLKDYGKPVIGIDYSEYALKLCAVGVHGVLARGTVEHLPFKDNSFGLVTSFEVLYHKQVGDDDKVIREIYRVCKKGGRILIIDSAFDFLKSKHDDFAHGVRRYTVKELSGKLKMAGFVMRKSSYLYMSIFPILCVVRAFKNIFIPKDKPSCDLHRAPAFINNMMIRVLRLEAVLLRKIALPFGVSVLCVAEKE
jgi:ubiquinone/menaquinone biosynthesis C-methylase UbiE